MINHILKYIEYNIDQPLSIDVLAKEAGYSKCHFVRKFRKQMNISPMEYVWRRRLVHAIDDIIAGQTNMSISEKYQFESSSTFCRAFKKAFSIRPSYIRLFKIMDVEQIKRESEIFLKGTMDFVKKEELLCI